MLMFIVSLTVPFCAVSAPPATPQRTAPASPLVSRPNFTANYAVNPQQFSPMVGQHIAPAPPATFSATATAAATTATGLFGQTNPTAQAATATGIFGQTNGGQTNGGQTAAPTNMDTTN